LKEKLYKAKDKLLDEQELSVQENMKTTKDLVVQFQGMQEKLKDNKS